MAVGAQRDSAGLRGRDLLISRLGPSGCPAWLCFLSSPQLLLLSPALQPLPVHHLWHCRLPGHRCLGLFSTSGLWSWALASWQQQITPSRAAFSLSSPENGSFHSKPLAAGSSPLSCLIRFLGPHPLASSLADIKAVPRPSSPSLLCHNIS